LCSNKSFIERAKQFSRYEVRLDSFWTNIAIVFNLSSAMINVLKKVLIFSHGNASVERGFSVNKECLIAITIDCNAVLVSVVQPPGAQ